MNEIMDISRLRMGTDGKGITTLVAFHKCPLRCTYCLNPQCLDGSTVRAEYSPMELLNAVKIDDIYFQMTGGGITFGGGEPLLYSRFISQFCSVADPGWKIRIETCLNVSWHMIQPLIDDVDLWIVDIKDMNPEIYLRYTEKNNHQVIDNLEKLSAAVQQDKILIRVPLIPGYNTDDDIDKSLICLEMFNHIDRITYFT